jgi:imidazole glycerol-phosphate synthase subunit HisH
VRTPTFAVVDYGAGNLVSIGNALRAVGAAVTIARRPADLEAADAIVVPGVGASAPAMTRLQRQSLVGPIRDAVAAGTWFVGICLGMQLLFEHSEEDGAAMLGLLAGDVVRLERPPRLPHIGWNTLELMREHPVLDGVRNGTPAYFVHSYAPRPISTGIVVAETTHGGRFPSVIVADQVIGFQFHPERSGEDGLRILANTVALVRHDDRSADTERPPVAGAVA